MLRRFLPYALLLLLGCAKSYYLPPIVASDLLPAPPLRILSASDLAWNRRREMILDSVVLEAARIWRPVSDSDSAVTILAVGDVMLTGSMEEFLRREGPRWPFRRTFGDIKSADAAIANLEAPFGLGGEPVEDKTYTFQMNPEYVDGLLWAGFDVVTLANNHTLDYGERGLLSTLSLLDSVGIAHCGAGTTSVHARMPAITKVGQYKVAWLGFSNVFPEEFWATRHKPGTAFGHLKHVVEDVENAQLISDMVVVSFHWSAELRSLPKDYQIALAHAAIDAGADLILGHHPHVLQSFEVYRGKVIAYSLGNFAFGSYSRRAVDSAMLRLRLHPEGYESAEIIPLSVNNYEVLFQPTVLHDSEADRVLSDVVAISDSVGTRVQIRGDIGVLIPVAYDTLAAK